MGLTIMLDAHNNALTTSKVLENFMVSVDYLELYYYE